MVVPVEPRCSHKLTKICVFYSLGVWQGKRVEEVAPWAQKSSPTISCWALGKLKVAQSGSCVVPGTQGTVSSLQTTKTTKQTKTVRVQLSLTSPTFPFPSPALSIFP